MRRKSSTLDDLEGSLRTIVGKRSLSLMVRRPREGVSQSV